MLKKSLTISLFFLFSLSIWKGTASAEGNLVVEVNSTPSTVNLAWENSGLNYKVYQEGKEIWKGSSNNFTIKNLKSDTQYNFIVTKLDDKGNITDSSSVRATTTSSEPEAQKLKTFSASSQDESESNSLENVSMSSSTDGSSVKLQWVGVVPDDDKKYEVYKNDKYLKTISGNELTDSDIELNKEYTYDIVGSKRISDERIRKIQEELSNKNIEITPEMEKKLYYETFKLTRMVDTNEKKNFQILSSSPVPRDISYTVRYTTFIPDKYVPNPFTGDSFVKISYFGGDDRSFYPFSYKYRTRADFKVIFGGNGYVSTGFYPDTNPTFLYDWQKNPMGIGQASTAGMKILNVKKASTSVSYQVNHDVGIPFGDSVSPDITYSYIAKIYKNGGYAVSGTHDGAPSHEMYRINNADNAYRTLHQAPNIDFDYLWPFYPNTSFKASY
ncbi:DUF3238 domain-containing protein [Priestia filamentosa]|uniref:DUF3238 domain-containing protein n=1 Tax=Priestia filamentosa TaxID=1402861 RepID=UPI003D2B07A0